MQLNYGSFEQKDANCKPADRWNGCSINDAKEKLNTPGGHFLDFRFQLECLIFALLC